MLLLFQAPTTFGHSSVTPTSRSEQFFSGADLLAVTAVERGDEAQLKLAQSQRADLNRPGRDGVVPFLYFIARKDDAALARLVKLGVRFDYQLPRALGPTFPENVGWVVADPDTRMLRAMLDAGFDPNFRIRGGPPLLYRTINPPNREALDLLLRYGADINAQYVAGRTVLHDAVQQESYALARYLIERGANPTIANRRGNTSIDFLRRDRQRARSGSPVAQEIDSLLTYLDQKGYR